MLGHYFIKYKLIRDMTYDRQQLLWQKQVTVIGSINLGSHINEYHTGVARFQNAASHRCSVQRQRFAPISLFFVAPDAYSWSFSEFFSVANVNSFFIDETNKDNISQQLFWAEEHGGLFRSVVQKASLWTLQTTVAVIKWFIWPQAVLFNVFKQ